MSMTKWMPLKELEDMRRDMERIFEEVFEPRRRRRWWPGGPGGEKGLIVPALDMYDRKTDFVIKVELPGVSRDNIDLTITKEAITIKGEIKKDEEAPEESYYARERVVGPFSRTIQLPTEVESERAKATFKDGILEIVLPKKAEEMPKEIKVNIG
jgi:HSP20 family protein